MKMNTNEWFDAFEGINNDVVYRISGIDFL